MRTQRPKVEVSLEEKNEANRMNIRVSDTIPFVGFVRYMGRNKDNYEDIDCMKAQRLLFVYHAALWVGIAKFGLEKMLG